MNAVAVKAGTVEVDGIAYAVGFKGFHKPLQVKSASGKAVKFQPWTCGRHLQALERHLKPTRSGVRMDFRGFSREVLDASGIPAELADELFPLTLWWAAGGDSVDLESTREGALRIRNMRIRLQPWTEGQRLLALTENVRTAEDGTRRFSIAGYLEAMLKASIVAITPAGKRFQELDSQATMGLIEEVLRLNVQGDREDEVTSRLRYGSQELARNTLRLCRALSWTPSRVWATPAAEVDRMLVLLDRAEGQVSPSATRQSGLGAHPDAIIIQVEDTKP